MRNNSTAIWLLLILTLGSCPIPGLAQQRPPAKRQPNIIFIMSDALRADHLGCYGYDLPTSPNIDRFAQGSTRFERAIAQASWTAI